MADLEAFAAEVVGYAVGELAVSSTGKTLKAAVQHKFWVATVKAATVRARDAVRRWRNGVEHEVEVVEDEVVRIALWVWDSTEAEVFTANATLYARINPYLFGE